MAQSEKELKSFLMSVEKESEKVSLKLNIQKINIMASGPITSRQIQGVKTEAMTNDLTGTFISLPICKLELLIWGKLRKAISEVWKN